MKYNLKLAVITAVLWNCFALTGCKKFLDVKPDNKLSVPNNLSDLQLLLDNYTRLNKGPAAPNIGSDEYYLKDANWSSLTDFNKDGHIWDPLAEDENDWNTLYNIVFTTNSVLEHLEDIPVQRHEDRWKSLKGSTLFFRAHTYYHLTQIYAPQYDPSSAVTDLGIPIRLTADFNMPTVRSTVQRNYDQIIMDLEEAFTLLPDNSSYKTRPDRSAAAGLLARVYLQMGNYIKANEYADVCLHKCEQSADSLMDYNTLTSSSAPFPLFNAEVIFHSKSLSSSALTQSRAIIDTNLFKSYDTNDLRKSLYFKENSDGTVAFKGSYDGTTGSETFDGIALDEIYLIRAECEARASNVPSALHFLNTLLAKRWMTGSFTPYQADTPTEALNLVLQERKKQLLLRGIRWADLRRLNKQDASITLTRILNNQTYTLHPNDLRYTLLIPQNVINLTGIPQNKR